MTTFDQVHSPGAVAASPSNPGRTLWVAVGALSVAVIAMGATLFYVVTKPSLPMGAATAAVQPAATAPVAQAAAEAPAAAAPAPVAAPAAPVHKPVAKAPPKPAPVQVARNEPQAPQPVPQPVAVPQPVRQVCLTCGTVESVNAVERKGQGTGLGAVAGGVLGGVLGNQVGKGNGRTAATVIGAVGGGVAGHMAEKHLRKETVYQVTVRMEDGSVRTVEQAQPVGVGTRVTLEGNALRGPQGQVYSAPAPAPRPAPVQTSNPYPA